MSLFNKNKKKKQQVNWLDDSNITDKSNLGGFKKSDYNSNNIKPLNQAIDTPNTNKQPQSNPKQNDMHSTQSNSTESLDQKAQRITQMKMRKYEKRYQAINSNQFNNQPNQSSYQPQTNPIRQKQQEEQKSYQRIQSAYNSHVSFVQSLKLFAKNWNNMSGCSSRSEYWWMQVWEFIINLAIKIIFGIFLASHSEHLIQLVFSSIIHPFSIFNLLVICLIAVSVWWWIASFTLGVRRLHDAGHSGACIWLNTIPIVGPLIVIYFDIQPSTNSQWSIGAKRNQKLTKQM